jgi:hypothetical protein
MAALLELHGLAEIVAAAPDTHRGERPKLPGTL